MQASRCRGTCSVHNVDVPAWTHRWGQSLASIISPGLLCHGHHLSTAILCRALQAFCSHSCCTSLSWPSHLIGQSRPVLGALQIVESRPHRLESELRPCTLQLPENWTPREQDLYCDHCQYRFPQRLSAYVYLCCYGLGWRDAAGSSGCSLQCRGSLSLLG